MVVLIDKIQPPTKIQKGGNYIFLHTYTIAIKIVPLVLQDYYFVGLILEYKGIIVKVRHTSKHKAKEKKAHTNANSRPSTGIDMAQAHPKTD